MAGLGRVRHTCGFTVLLWLRRIKSEGIYGWGDQAESVLVKIKDCLHILEGTFLTGSPRGGHHLAQNIEREVGIRCLGDFYDDLRQYQPRDVFTTEPAIQSDPIHRTVPITPAALKQAKASKPVLQTAPSRQTGAERRTLLKKRLR